MKPKTIFLLTILIVYALGIAAQGVLTNSCDNDEFTAKNPIRWGYGKANAKRGLEYIQDHATGIVDITTMPPGGSQPPVWRGASGYTLNGRRLSGKPSPKGVYINKGVKIRE